MSTLASEPSGVAPKRRRRMPWSWPPLWMPLVLTAAAAGCAALAGAHAPDGYWSAALRGELVASDAASPWYLLHDIAVIGAYLLAAVSWWAYVGDTIVTLDDQHGRYAPLRDRLDRARSVALALIVIGIIADVVEDVVSALILTRQVHGPGWQAAAQGAGWLKWWHLVIGASVIVLAGFVAFRRRTTLNLGAAGKAAEQKAEQARQDEEGVPLPGLHPAPDGSVGRPTVDWLPPRRDEPARIGVSLSGGGIRSASFSMGALQAISMSTLGAVRYVTSVSGGGYMAAAWASIVKTGTSCVGRDRPFVPRGREERWVRHHTDYLINRGVNLLGALATVIFGLLLNLVLLLGLLSAVAHPIGWVIGAAHEETRAETPIVEITEQPRLRITHVAPADPAVVAAAAECDVCAPGREQVSGFVVKFAGTRMSVALSERVERRPKVVERRPGVVEDAVDVTVHWALVIEGAEGLVVVRQPILDIEPVDPRIASNRTGGGDRILEVARQPRLTVTAGPEVTSGRLGSLDASDVEGWLDVDQQPRVKQRSGTLGREDVTIPAWMWASAGALALATVAVFALDGRLGRWYRLRGLFGSHVLTRALALDLAVFAAVLIALPQLARTVPALIGDLPGSETLATPQGQAGVGAVALLALARRLLGPVSATLKRLRGFRGRGLVLDALVGLVVLATLTFVFLALVDLAAANGPHGKLGGVHERWLHLDVLPDWVRMLVWLVPFVLLLVPRISSHGWSLYSFYRSRLRSAFFLSVDDGGRVVPLDRKGEDGWTWGGADGPRLTGLTSAPDGPPIDEREEWVVCATANIRGDGAAAPGRNAGSFTFSSSWVGGPEVGWLETSKYLSTLPEKRRRDVCVPSTVVMSAAAFSPAMGKQSSSWQGRLMALFNLRLGVWVPTPSVVLRSSNGSIKLRKPDVFWFLRELLGVFDRTAEFVYVTDGGHWENLGLVELLRRGCTDIWMVSAAGDGPDSFETLAQAIALAREELGVEFNVELEGLRAPSEPLLTRLRRLLRSGAQAPVASESHVSGTFRYPADEGSGPGVIGTIHIVEATLLDDLPWDLHSYAEKNVDYPDISTAYQLMDHRDFEAYRMLGFCQMARALEDEGHWPAAQSGPPITTA